jgi:hypothetical protein
MSFKEKWNDLDEARLRLAIDRAVAGHVWFEPLLVTGKYFTLPYPVPDDFNYLVGVPSVEHHLRSWLPVGDSGWVARRDRHRRLGAAFAQMCRFVRDFHGRGGIVVAGTDEMQPGLALLDEVQLLANCGLSPMAALGAATREAAVALGFRDGGTLEAGKVADFLILESDPLEDVGHLRQIRRVVKGGYQYDPASLLASRAEAFQTALRRTWALRATALILSVAVAILLGHRVWRRRRSPSGYGS